MKSETQIIDKNIDGLEQKKQETISDIVHAQHTMSYEEDWCIQSVDLSKEDTEFATQASKDWAVERGRISFDKQLENGVV